MFRAIRAAALAFTVGASLTLVVATPGPADAAAKPPKPVVSKVAPSSGPTSGGTKVTIKGKNLKTATKVLFGTGKGTKLKVVSDKKLTVLTPPHAAGKVKLQVKTKGGKSAASAKTTFTFLAPPPPPPPPPAPPAPPAPPGVPPVVTEIAPPSGPIGGGAVVTVTGTDLAGATSVSFGGVSATPSVSTATSLTVTSPAHSEGTVHIQVVTPAGTSAAVDEDQFTYLAPDSRAYSAPLPPDADPSNQGAGLNAVDCPAVQECFAVGTYLSGGQRVPLVEQRVDADSWQFFRPDLPADADLNAEVELVDVDCATPSFCVAIGTYVDDSPEPLSLPLIETWNGVEWLPSSQASQALPDNGFTESTLLSDIDCPAVGTCVAVGRYDDVDANDVPLVLQLSGGSWAVRGVATGDTANLFSVDCPTAAACVAVGEFTAAGKTKPFAVSGPGTWTVNTALSLPNNAASSSQASLHEVACSAAGTCLAAGSYLTAGAGTHGLIERLAGGTWSPTEAAPPAGVGADDPEVVFNSVSCASTCAAVGQFLADAGGLRPLLFRSGAAPEVTQGAVPGDPTGTRDSGSFSVTCTSGNRCLGLGYHDDGTGSWQPLLSTLSAGSWTASTGPSPDDLDGVLRMNSSAVDGAVGVAVGYYTDAAGAQQALIMLDLPIAP